MAVPPSEPDPQPVEAHVDERNWRDFAACRGMVTEQFFPAGDVAPVPVAQAEQAKAVCRQCLEFAMTTKEPFGIWGGLTEGERTALRRQRRRQAS
jgi:WhiB family redox-sensing transcriptional regulator